MLSEDTKSLELTISIIYIDLKSLMVKIDGCKNDRGKSSTKVSEHILSGFSMSSLEYLFQNHGVKSSNPSERIYVNKIENGLNF